MCHKDASRTPTQSQAATEKANQNMQRVAHLNITGKQILLK